MTQLHDHGSGPVSNASIRVLLLGNDQAFAWEATSYFQAHGVSIAWFTDCLSGIEAAIRTSPDALLLDLASAGLDGVSLCGRLRARSDLPLIALSAASDDAERVVMLECGADDCVSKPPVFRELLARIRAHVRRARGQMTPDARVLQIGDLRIDPQAMRASMGSRTLRLTTFEFKLLHRLAERAGRPVTREQLVSLVRGSSDDGLDRSIDSHVSRLRHKLGDNPRDPTLVKTVRGTGYLLAGPVDDCRSSTMQQAPQLDAAVYRP